MNAYYCDRDCRVFIYLATNTDNTCPACGAVGELVRPADMISLGIGD
jgi:hypothetical protein